MADKFWLAETFWVAASIWVAESFRLAESFGVAKSLLWRIHFGLRSHSEWRSCFCGGDLLDVEVI